MGAPVKTPAPHAAFYCGCEYLGLSLPLAAGFRAYFVPAGWIDVLTIEEAIDHFRQRGATWMVCGEVRYEF